MQEKYTIVVGSGISGLTMALLQAQRGKRVVLVEKLPFIGGYMRRFTRNGLRYDTGFHFTGGNGGVLQQILNALDFRPGDFQISLLPTEVYLAEDGTYFRFPNQGLDALCDAMCNAFSSSAAAIRRYYEAELACVVNTPLYDLKLLKDLNMFTGMTEYDGFTVNGFMDKLGIENTALRALLPIMALCHGTPPGEASFSYHCRCSYSLDCSISSIAGGSDVFLRSFERKFKEYGVEILTNCHIKRLDVSETAPLCKEAVLSNGISLPVERIFFAIHPAEILPLLPERLISRSIKRRFDALKPTCSCFVVHGYFDQGCKVPETYSIFLDKNDLDTFLLPGANGRSTCLVTSNDPANRCPTFTLFSAMFKDDCPSYKGEQYADFKASTADRLMNMVYERYPEYRGRMHIGDTSTPYTLQRYSPPLGSAYGTRQILAQSRIAGTLPVGNCYNLGHHAQFPGVLGCIMSAMMLNQSIQE